MFLAQRRALLLAAVGAAFACFAPVARSAETRLAKPEWDAIKRVISQQLAALKAGDGDKAFGFATAGIQAQFGDADHFMAMVQGAYSDLLRARYTEFLEGAVIDGVVVQPLRLIAPDNTVRVALYSLERQKRGGWRISGCVIAPSTVRAA
jgi:L-aminopeptidase/D-esterase-like protein